MGCLNIRLIRDHKRLVYVIVFSLFFSANGNYLATCTKSRETNHLHCERSECETAVCYKQATAVASLKLVVPWSVRLQHGPRGLCSDSMSERRYHNLL